MGLIFSSRYTSVVKETSVSWAELKFVILRVGMPKHLRTGMAKCTDRQTVRQNETDRDIGRQIQLERERRHN